jgi:hypothetical protein
MHEFFTETVARSEDGSEHGADFLTSEPLYRQLRRNNLK